MPREPQEQSAYTFDRRGVTFDMGLGDRKGPVPSWAPGEGLRIWRVESGLLWLKHRWDITLERDTRANL